MYYKTLQKKQKKIKKRNIYLIVSVSVIFLVIAAIDYYNKYNSLLILQSQQRQIANLEDQKRDLRLRELIAQKKLKEDSLAIENQCCEIEKRRLLLESKESTILKQEKQVISYRQRADSAMLENERFFKEIGEKSKIIGQNENVILLIKDYSEINKKINSLLFNVDHTISSDKKTIKSFASQFVETFNLSLIHI